MAHEHSHSGSSFYIEQLATIVLSAAFGAAGLAMALDPEKKMLNLILVPKLHITVLLCGICLLVLAAVRTVTLLMTVLGRRQAHHPEHAHEHHHHELVTVGTAAHAHEHHEGEICCHHDHEHETHEHAHADETGCCGHEDGHSHSHASAPLRYVVLLLPIAFFMMNLPNKAMWLAQAADATGIDVSDTAKGPSKGEMQLDFKELDQASYSGLKREAYTGHVGRLTGQISHTMGNPKVFTLVRSRMTCCAADVISIQVFIVATQPVSIPDGTWVDVGGRIEFQYQEKPGSQGSYVPVLRMTDIKTIDAPANPYIY
ncbi:MAG TPA: hypothetical protein VFA18_20010 [Gemmataceae bacterium]|nr:hypothetical protein [Gemmataceae bacterium]